MMDDKTYKPRFWKTSEVRWLKDNAAGKSLAELSAHLERSPGSIQCMCNKLRLHRKPQEWTEEQDIVLMAAYPYVTNSILAKVLGKSVNKVSRRGVILGLVKEIGGKGMLRDYYRALLYKNIEDMYDALNRDEQMEMCIALINRLTYGNKKRVGLEA